MADEPAFDDFTSPLAESLVSRRTVGDVTYATITSPSMTSVELATLRAALFDAVREGEGVRVLVVAMERVEYMNSRAIGMLVEVHNAARPRGMRVLLAGVRPEIRDMLGVTKITRVIPVCSTADELDAALQD